VLNGTPLNASAQALAEHLSSVVRPTSTSRVLDFDVDDEDAMVDEECESEGERDEFLDDDGDDGFFGGV